MKMIGTTISLLQLLVIEWSYFYNPLSPSWDTQWWSHTSNIFSDQPKYFLQYIDSNSYYIFMKFFELVLNSSSLLCFYYFTDFFFSQRNVGCLSWKSWEWIIMLNVDHYDQFIERINLDVDNCVRLDHIGTV